MTTHRCAECGAQHPGEQTCQDDFYQFLYWENEDNRVVVVHHLMVLCYYMQHPHLYTPEGLEGAKELLTGFVAKGITPPEMRQQLRDKVDSGKRQHKIAHGEPASYDRPIHWRMTAADVVAGGLDNYIDNIRKWAQTMYEDLNGS